MLKIIDVHASAGATGEYVVLQNQGLTTQSLRGWALCTDAYLHGEAVQVAEEMYIFRNDIPIEPYMRVVLFTGNGRDGWEPTIDGRQAYCAYWGRGERVWTHADNVHLIHLLCSRRVAQPLEAYAVATA